MMSDTTDDTDVLLLIPPDLFVIHSENDSDVSVSCQNTESAVVSELIEQVQLLESRVLAIEHKNSPNITLDHNHLSFDSTMNYRQTLPRTKFSVSSSSNFQKSPGKYSFLHKNPDSFNHSTFSNNNDEFEINKSSNFNSWSNNHDVSKKFFESSKLQNNNNSMHGVVTGFTKETPSLITEINTRDYNSHTKSCGSLPLTDSSNKINDSNVLPLQSFKNINLVEVEELLERIEENRSHGLDPSNGNNNNEGQQSTTQVNFKKPLSKRSLSIKKSYLDGNKMDQQKLKFSINGYTHSNHESIYQSEADKKKDVSDVTINYDSSFSSFNTEKFMADYKPNYETSDCKSTIEPIIFEDDEKFISTRSKDPSLSHKEKNSQNYTRSNMDYSLVTNKDNSIRDYNETLVSKYTKEITKSQTISPSVSAQINHQDSQITSCKSCPSIFKTPSNKSIPNSPDHFKKPDCSSTPNGSNKSCGQRNNVNLVKNTEPRQQRQQKFLNLSDFWNQDSNKTQEEKLGIKLEEEKLRREHCEKMIQDLQKKLLEQQEKIAVALRVDDDKNSYISQLHELWKKMKENLIETESEKENLQKLIKSISEKHQSSIAEYQEQVKRNEEELSKALNLATGYKEKSDCLVKKKTDLLKSHADELENYKLLVQQAENKYEEMKKECQKLFEKNQQTDETLKIVQQDLNKELIKSNEVKSELAIIHKALDTCETELTILRQEKENLQLKLREEIGRNNILEQGKVELNAALDEAKKAEKIAKHEVKSLAEQHEKLRAELREVYQKQVDEVVKTKLQEFQKQLDSAEMIFQNELDAKQRAIAEIAARKIKSVIDKHQLEINLIEEKHKEEKKLFEVKVAQETQKITMLEAQLNTYRKSKTNIVEQLHSMMQKQWQQALLIISGGNLENLPSLQQISMDKLFDSPNQMNLDLFSKFYDSSPTKPIKLERQRSTNTSKQDQFQMENFSNLNEETPLSSRKELKNDSQKYIKMILDMQQSQEDYPKPKFFNTSPPSSLKENSVKRSTTVEAPKDVNASLDYNSTWQPVSETSINDSEYLSVPHKFELKTDMQHKQKPPWK